uniref:Uncharacterized protein n=1 Tax=Anguilla anguilla TaxID=7936 RepID=A0A0E9QFR8_ANGAN
MHLNTYYSLEQQFFVKVSA